jgi:biotin-(acetyl-CoA carboxylase) ligase
MPDFPPLLHGRLTRGEPFAEAVAAASTGCEAGLIVHRSREDAIEAALVLAPDVALSDAAAMLLVAGLGFADAFGALAPPEKALHLDWPGGIRIEGAHAGAIRAAAPPGSDAEIPEWLVIHLHVAVAVADPREPGARGDVTDLRSEGIDLAPDDLLAAWARHTLSWIARWEDAGMGLVHRDWVGRAWGLGAERTLATPGGTRSGLYQGLDERGGMLLKTDAGTVLVPLTEMLERRC